MQPSLPFLRCPYKHKKRRQTLQMKTPPARRSFHLELLMQRCTNEHDATSKMHFYRPRRQRASARSRTHF